VNKRERFMAAVAGREVDHPPSFVWLHFASDRLPAEETARRHARFFTDYDWDVCKVMNDYRYPLPEGLEALESARDMLRFKPLPATHPALAEQPRAIARLRSLLGPDWPLVDTAFDPFQQVMRKLGYGRAPFVYGHREEALEMLDAVTRSLCGQMVALRKAGCDAVLYSINGAICQPNPRGVDDEIFRTFLRPFDLRVLEAMQGMVRILHVHGTHLDIRRVLDYPCEVVSISDRLPGVPSLKEMRALTDKCLMGGIDETRIAERSVPELTAEMRDAIAQAGTRRFILSPGCTIPPQTPRHLLECVRSVSRSFTARA